jgi:rhamnosyltransferase
MQLEPYANGVSFAYKCYKNNLASKNFIKNIIFTFEKNPRLGMLMPPAPFHGNFYHVIGHEWSANYDNTIALAKKLGIKTDIIRRKEPISPLGTMFWFRPLALKALFNYGWKYDDFPKEPNSHDGSLLHAIERIYGFVVQHEGFYPAWLMSDQFSRIEFTNYHFILQELNTHLMQYHYSYSFIDLILYLRSGSMIKTLMNHGMHRTKAIVKKICHPVLLDFLRNIKQSLKNNIKKY